jgi:putative oxidoreductase
MTPDVKLREDAVRYGLFPFIARLLLVLEFLIGANGKISGWSGQAAYMASHRMTHVAPLLGAALVIELAGSLCLIVGFRANAAAAVMFVYLGIVSVRLHDFWNMTGNAAAGTMTQFFKNLGMMGGLLMIAVYGAGSWSLDEKRANGRRLPARNRRFAA